MSFSQEHDPPLREWIPYRSKYLTELLRAEGIEGGSGDKCMTCGSVVTSPSALIKCRDCVNGSLECEKCCVRLHQQNPFHRVDRWNGLHFEHTTLKDCGLKLMLGHKQSGTCSYAIAGPLDFVVLHTNGFHPVNVCFCQCDQLAASGDRIQQLLRAELYPATTTDPTTACTFRLLEQFHILSSQSKVSAYDFYLSLEMITDHSGVTRSQACISLLSSYPIY
ncbi:hypothetical protein K474DRAFT_1610043 [Panus rudis PR-1116 ss-1]|nr:hypothetical protein K474DRAFT_1610043 [Panus rudis PR-1116 ss-1]